MYSPLQGMCISSNNGCSDPHLPEVSEMELGRGGINFPSLIFLGNTRLGWIQQFSVNVMAWL
jgi:hypothetical protein